VHAGERGQVESKFVDKVLNLASGAPLKVSSKTLVVKKKAVRTHVVLQKIKKPSFDRSLLKKAKAAHHSTLSSALTGIPMPEPNGADSNKVPSTPPPSPASSSGSSHTLFESRRNSFNNNLDAEVCLDKAEVISDKPTTNISIPLAVQSVTSTSPCKTVHFSEECLQQQQQQQQQQEQQKQQQDQPRQSHSNKVAYLMDELSSITEHHERLWESNMASYRVRQAVSDLKSTVENQQPHNGKSKAEDSQTVVVVVVSPTAVEGIKALQVVVDTLKPSANSRNNNNKHKHIHQQTNHPSTIEDCHHYSQQAQQLQEEPGLLDTNRSFKSALRTAARQGSFLASYNYALLLLRKQDVKRKDVEKAKKLLEFVVYGGSPDEKMVEDAIYNLGVVREVLGAL
jgi:hypothetical protein